MRIDRVTSPASESSSASGRTSVPRSFHHPAVHIAERMRRDERRGIELAHDGLHLADLQPRDDAEENLLVLAAEAAAALVDGHAAAEIREDPCADFAAPAGHDRDRGELLDA